MLVKISNGALWAVPQIDELRRRGHEVVAILPAGPGRLTDELNRRGVRVLELPFDLRFRPTPSTLRGLARLRALLRELRPDAVIYHLYASALATRLSALGLPLRRIHMVAGPLYLESPVIRPVERLLWRLDHLTICGTAYTSQRYGRLGCPPQRRPVATCGVDTDRFAPAAGPDPAAPASPTALAGSVGRIAEQRDASPAARLERRTKARAELGIPAEAFLTVMVAYVYPPKRLAHRGRGIKGHDVLLPAWRLFRDRHPDAHLLLVGGGWTAAGEAQRQALIEQFGVATDPGVTWLPTVGDVRGCYAAADLSISPSLSEGHGAAVEAGAMGVPSIVSDAGGLPETVDRASGWVVPRDDSGALLAAWEQAYREHRAGRLAGRGAAARRRMVTTFDNRVAAVLVANAVEAQVADAVEARIADAVEAGRRSVARR